MDLLNIKPATQKVEILHPGTGERTGFVIEVTSMESDAVKKVGRRQTDEMIRKRKQRLSAAEIEAHAAERLSAAVVGWEWKGDAAWGTEKLEPTKDNIATVMKTGWVRRQVEEALNDEAAFFSGAE